MGQEIAIDGGVCCGWCQPVPQACSEGRALWKGELAAKWKAALACNVDTDCIVTVVGGPCGSTCLDAIARSQITPISEWSNFRSKGLCATCFNAPAATDCPAVQIVGAACTDGVCVPTKL